MSEPNLWWMLAGAAVIVELLSGTFYLLMLAIGMVAAALSAHGGAPLSVQLVVAAVVGGGAVVIWHQARGRQPRAERASANKDVSLDIGQTVTVTAWDEQRNATVSYRGADWAATLAAGAEAGTGLHRIVEVVGSRLIVKPVQH
jgi:membrane protein implicated in regulation of membrane protease activity